MSPTTSFGRSNTINSHGFHGVLDGSNGSVADCTGVLCNSSDNIAGGSQFLTISYQFNESCQGTVPAAIRAFLDGEGFEDCIRTAVSLGGDADTLGCITGSIAEAYYDVPQALIDECRKRLPDDILKVVDAFYDITKATMISLIMLYMVKKVTNVMEYYGGYLVPIRYRKNMVYRYEFISLIASLVF